MRKTTKALENENILVFPFVPRAEFERRFPLIIYGRGGAIIDEGFDGAALENLIQQIQAREAEVILSGIAPLSKDVVAELQANQLLSRKDLPEAIAYAFQIAEAQRPLL